MNLWLLQQTLDISSCQNVSHVGLSSLTIGTRCLRQLILAYGSPVSSLTPLPLNIWGAYFFFKSLFLTWLIVHWMPAQVTPALADTLQRLSALQSITLDCCPVTCSGLKAIGNWCVSLREISLSKCSGVTDEGLSSLVTRHKDLRKLDITCCRKITHVSIAHLQIHAPLLHPSKWSHVLWCQKKLLY